MTRVSSFYAKLLILFVLVIGQSILAAKTSLSQYSRAYRSENPMQRSFSGEQISSNFSQPEIPSSALESRDPSQSLSGLSRSGEIIPRPSRRVSVRNTALATAASKSISGSGLWSFAKDAANALAQHVTRPQREVAKANINLLDAVKRADEQSIETSLASGADINSQDEYGMTALHWAVWDNLGLITQALLLKRPDLSIRDKDGRTPLFLAVLARNKDMVERLIDGGATTTINLSDNNGYAPLYVAVTNGDINIVDYLVRKKASLNTPAKDGTTPLYASINHPAILKYLLERPDIDLNARDREGQTALHKAVLAGNNEAVRLLIEKGADYRVSDTKGKLPLDYAIEQGKREIVSLLPQMSSGIFSRSTVNPETFLAAVRKVDVELVKELLQKGFNVNQANARGWTPLHEAVNKGGVPALVDMLLQAGANPFAYGTTDEGKRLTPIHLARNHPNILDMLANENYAENGLSGFSKISNTVLKKLGQR